MKQKQNSLKTVSTLFCFSQNNTLWLLKIQLL